MTATYLTIDSLVARKSQLPIAIQTSTEKSQIPQHRTNALGCVQLGWSFALVQRDAQNRLCRYLCHPPLPSAEPCKHKAVCAFTANKQQFTRRLTTEEYIQIPKHIIEGQR